MIESEVWKPVSTRPGIGGTTGREPAPIRMCSAAYFRPSMSSTFGDTNRAVPSIKVMLSDPVALYWRPPSAIGSIRPNTRSRIAFQSAPWKRTSMQSRLLLLASSARSAGNTNIFDGMQPTLRQVPPNVPRSTIAIFQSDRKSGIALADPLPMMIRSKWFGSFCSVGTLCLNTAGRGFLPVWVVGRQLPDGSVTTTPRSA